MDARAQMRNLLKDAEGEAGLREVLKYQRGWKGRVKITRVVTQKFNLNSSNSI